jgi:hypothetical protein
VRELRRRGYPVEVFDPARGATYTAVVYSKVYDEVAQAQARRLRANGTRIVFDLCDNHFYNPSNHESVGTAAARLRRMLREVDELVASTPAMAEVLRAEVGADIPLTVIGDAVENTIEGVRVPIWERWWSRSKLRALASRLRADPGVTRLVWFGSHGGPSGDHGMGDLEVLRPILERLHTTTPLSLTVISNSASKFESLTGAWRLPTHYLEWNPETFLDALRLHSISVIPVRQNDFTRCKSNNRLTTSLAAGLAVAASGIPSYTPFEGCCVLDDWYEGLRRYILDPEARQRSIAEGQALVRRLWTLRSIADQWQRYFDGLRERSSRRGA